MTPTHLCILLLAVVAASSVRGQNDEIPIENDNQFPPDPPPDMDDQIFEGSGEGTLEEPKIGQPTEKIPTPITPLEDVILPSMYNADQTVALTEDLQCPEKCLCHSAAGDSNNYVVDCSGYELVEFPAPLDSRTTTLNVQNNKLTEIPKTVSLLKNLQVLNAENNSISDLALGSISELHQLKILKLSNNRIIEYPIDLKNSFGLSKLEELDLGGNDMRADLTPELFSIFKSLKILTIPSTIPIKASIMENLCGSLRKSLEKVCTDKCSTEVFECPDAPQNLDEDNFLDVIPGMISLETSNPYVNETGEDEINDGTEENLHQTDTTSGIEVNVAASDAPILTNTNENITLSNSPEDTTRSANKEQISPIQRQSMIVEMPQNEQTNTKKADPVVKVGATTDASTGGVNKSVIGFIVAGMVLVVAGITIKKNWGSIRKRFSSSATHNERTTENGTNANGTAPEEVPLQAKNPV